MCRVNFHQMRWNLRWNLWGLPSCNSQVKHLQKEKVEPSIWKEKKLTEFASNTCSAIQGSRPHQNTTSLLPCVASTSIRCVGTCVGTCGVYHLAIPKWNICKKKRLSLPFEKTRRWQNLHRTDALQFKALGLIRILPACCHACVASTSIRCVGTCVGTCGVYHLAIPKWNICKKKRLSLPWEKKRSWQNLHRTDALQFKALGLIRILPACCHVSRQLPSDALELTLELVWSTILQFPSETSAKRKGWAFHLKRKEVDRICIEHMLCNSRL